MTPQQLRGTYAAEVARALTSWVAGESSLEIFAEASTERHAEYTTAELLAAASAEDSWQPREH